MADASGPAASSATTLGPLRHSVFRAVWLSSMVSNFGGIIQSVGASWMMVSLSGSATLVALVQSSVTLPIMLLSLLAGALADNMERRRLMIGAQAFMLIISLLLALFAWEGLLGPWLLLTFTFLIGCGTALYSPAWQASVGDMVPRPDLPGAIALNSMGFNLARSAGPAIGGAVVATLGAAAAFAINAVSYVGLILVLVRWSPPQEERPLPPERIGVAVSAGLRYVAMSPAIRIVLLRSFVFGLGASAVPSLMPLIARDGIGGGPIVYGVLLGAFGLGAVAAALLSAPLRRALNQEAIVRISCLLFAAGAVGAGLSHLLVLTVVAQIAAGAGWVLTLSTLNVTVQMQSPRWVVARALSLYQTSAFGAMALGSWCWGLVAEHGELSRALIAAGAVQLLTFALGLRLPLPASETLDLTPLRRWQPPDPLVPIEERSGPVVVTIEYRIAPEDRPAFLGAMAERRRIRRRDGARHWTLLRDLADPELWIERFHLPTWIDYIRHNNRITHDDAGIHDKVRALHKGPSPPVVRRMIERQTGSLPRSGEFGPMALAEPLTDPTRSA